MSHITRKREVAQTASAVEVLLKDRLSRRFVHRPACNAWGGSVMNAKGVWTVIIGLLLVLIGFGISSAEYKWVDKDGTIHLVDTPPLGGSQETPATDDSPRKQLRKSAVSVEIYTVSWCSYCRQAREYLRSRGIAFTEYDVEKDKDASVRAKRLNPEGGVPVAVINGKVIRGFSSAAYDRAFAGQP